MDKPLCTICQPSRRHGRNEPHVFADAAAVTIVNPGGGYRDGDYDGKMQFKGGDPSRVVEALPTASVTIVRRDKAKQAAYMRDYRKRVKAGKAGKSDG